MPLYRSICGNPHSRHSAPNVRLRRSIGPVLFDHVVCRTGSEYQPVLARGSHFTFCCGAAEERQVSSTFDNQLCDSS